MQYNTIPYLKKTIYLPWLMPLIKGGLLLTAIVIVYQKLNQDSILAWALVKAWSELSTGKFGILMFSLSMLSCLNWGLEAKKWQVLSRKIETLTFSQALSGILSGLSLAFITPHAWGDYLGRIWQLKVSNRFEALGAVLLGRVSQYLITVLFGLLGIYFMWVNHFSTFGYKLWLGLFGVIVLTAILSFFLWKKDKHFKSFIELMAKKWAWKYLKVITNYSLNDLNQVLLLSGLRYITFSGQFLLLLHFMDIPLNSWVLFAGITWIFLAKSTLPSFNFLSDLGIREFSAILFFEFYGVDLHQIVVASLTLWLINIVAPTVIGASLLLRMRLYNN